jgi:hypothetical protein
VEREKIKGLLGETLREELRVYPQQYEISALSCTVFPVKGPHRFYLGVWQRESTPLFEEPLFSWQDPEKEFFLLVYPFSWKNYLLLAQHLPYLRPAPFDNRPSFGCGDRLGMVSGAHLKALEKFPVFPVIAQQSPRELDKTHRTFSEVLLGAAWGVLESGYQGPFGADADHVKEEKHLLEARDLGYTMYTLDLSDEVDFGVFNLDEKTLLKRFDKLGTRAKEIFNLYRGKEWKLSPEVMVDFSEEKLLPVLLAYLPAIDRVEYFYALLSESVSSFDLEISLDEGPRETSPEAHFFVAEELHRRKIDFHSLAPRFPGRFEKGVEYVGDLEELTLSFQTHATIQKNLTGYRLSLHSGSDKFSVYSSFFRATGGIFHVKTSGTSWLSALETIMKSDPELFRSIYSIAYDTLEENLKAYSLSLDKADFPTGLEKVDDKHLPAFFFQDKVRQMLHIAYGPVLEALGDRLREVLFREEEKHYRKVSGNIEKHLAVLFGESK